MLKLVGFELVFPAAWPSVFYHKGLQLLLAVYVDDFKMAGPKANMSQGWKLIGSKIDMDNPTPLGRYLGCEHIPRDCKLTKHDHPFAHVFDKSIPDPAAKSASAAPTQDYTEIFPEEGVLVRHHLQPRKATYRPSKEESALMRLGQIRYTEVNPLSGSDGSEKWDSASSSGKHGELWTGRTYLVTDDLDKASAVAAVARTATNSMPRNKPELRLSTT